MEKLEIKANINGYSQEELEFRAVATYQLLKTEVGIVASWIKNILENSNDEELKSKVISEDEKKILVPEILAFFIFNIWHINLNIFKEEKAEALNAILTEVFMYKFGIKDQEIFRQYYQEKPANDTFNDMTWKFYLFGKAIARSLGSEKDARIILPISLLMTNLTECVNRTLNITLNLERGELEKFMASVEERFNQG